ncbi:hypothetical protein P153DRAFT_393204 [Dothidotthia symphoricarpi CBS 119687]|uniref:BTB domain-containing protein n=1 Tax=Dothidotthia symphoricarpi CBS 119687 TaxID=1392245 RepID=A0A6A6AN19_9PLEO|nr:uncharacterized protein P153DRAFT_393204 [Dothidotthia symphoricarpi CBS 119687]KAF2133382.1 hypothetical protein P153DRAFT_393204 [Dothidotthia symphoricarpi CBS 119687]
MSPYGPLPPGNGIPPSQSTGSFAGTPSAGTNSARASIVSSFARGVSTISPPATNDSSFRAQPHVFGSSVLPRGERAGSSSPFVALNAQSVDANNTSLGSFSGVDRPSTAQGFGSGIWSRPTFADPTASSGSRLGSGATQPVVFGSSRPQSAVQPLFGSHTATRPSATLRNPGLTSVDNGFEQPRVHLLSGPSIEIVVGSANNSATSNHQDSWTLPKALVDRHSTFLRTAPGNRIYLPGHDPKIFSLFVGWMYYDHYRLITAAELTFANLDAHAWVLGSKLLCVKFQNYAMSRLYIQHTAVSTPQPISTADVEYVCQNSTAGSKLRQFFFDIVATHFADPERVSGGPEAWDWILLEHAEARSLILQGYRMALPERKFMKTMKEYMVEEEAPPMNNASVSGEIRVTPAKRDAEGLAVKREAHDD